MVFILIWPLAPFGKGYGQPAVNFLLFPTPNGSFQKVPPASSVSGPGRLPGGLFFQEETEDAEVMAKTGLLKPLTDDERRLVVNCVAEAIRRFRQMREKGTGH